MSNEADKENPHRRRAYDNLQDAEAPILDAWLNNAAYANTAQLQRREVRKMDSPKTPRQKLLEEAIAITTKDRNAAYGNPEDNFKNIADLWVCYLSAHPQPLLISSADVAVMMILMKAARLSTNLDHRDSAVDIAGYAACLADIQAVRAEDKFRRGLVNRPHKDIDGVSFPEDKAK